MQTAQTVPSFTYYKKVSNPPTRERVNLTAHKPGIHQAGFPGAFMQYVMRNIFWGVLC